MSCRFCWTRALSTIGLSALFSAAGLLHLVDPQAIVHYGFPTWSSYLLGVFEISAICGMLFIGVRTHLLLGLVALVGLYCHVTAGESYLVPFPVAALIMAGTLEWANTRKACACSLAHQANRSS